jgi:hypothetical protein
MLEKGVLTLGGSDVVPDPRDPGILDPILRAIFELYEWLQGVEDRAAAALRSGNFWLLLFLWLVWNDLNNRLVQEQAHLEQLRRQYDEEQRLIEAKHETATAVETPAAVATEFGYVIGNMSTSKREVHVPNCEFVHLIRPDHVRTFDTLAAARAGGLDNCYDCIGGSTR